VSGIVGILNLDGMPVDRELLSRMTDSMAFRGPERQSIWIDGNVGFGHAMLSTNELAKTEQQPLTVDGKVFITADARIDGQGGTVTDAESVLNAYQQWGEECVQHLIGDFAFAIWDGRTRRIFCARDHFGVKPFFFARVANSFIFSNTLNTLRLDARVSDALNENAIGDYLLFGINQDLSTTTFRDIQRLPGAHSLTFTNGSNKTRRYWTPAMPARVTFRNPEAYVERFSELLSQAVQDRSRTTSVAVSMSGGLDSTAVAAVCRDLLPVDCVLKACTVVYDNLIPDNERYYSNAAACHIDIPIRHINADQYSLFDERMAGDMDQPEPFLLSPLSGQFNDLLRLCANGGRVALTGWDGDAFMNEPANSYFSVSAKSLRLKELFTGMGRYVWTQRSLPPIGFRTLVKRMTCRQKVNGFFPKWIDESFEKRLGLRERYNEVYFNPGRKEKTTESRPSAFRQLNSKMWAAIFEGYDSGSTKLHLEVRHPFIDLRLVEYLLAIPSVPWCVNKHILRVAMKKSLPATVLDRPKTPLWVDPVVQTIKRSSVRWLDSFEVNPLLEGFVDLKHRRPVTDEVTAHDLWASLRVFALNYWLTNSRSVERRFERERGE